MMKVILSILACLLAVCGPVYAQSVNAANQGVISGEAYATANLQDLIQTHILLDGVDIKNNAYIDDYAKNLYCGLYKDKFSNDFEWNKVRQELIGKLTSKKEYYRALYQISSPVYLGRYNFETQDFPFEKNTAIVNVGRMELYAPGYGDKLACSEIADDKPVASLPKKFFIKLTEPLTLDRIKMPVASANELLERMDAMGNAERLTYLRFRIKVIAVDKTNNNPDVAIFVAQITDIDVFLDAQLTKLAFNVPLTKEDAAGF